MKIEPIGNKAVFEPEGPVPTQHQLARQLLAINRKRVQFLVGFPDAQELIARAHIDYAVYHGRTAADSTTSVKLPEYLSIFGVVRSNKVAI